MIAEGTEIEDPGRPFKEWFQQNNRAKPMRPRAGQRSNFEDQGMFNPTHRQFSSKNKKGKAPSKQPEPEDKVMPLSDQLDEAMDGVLPGFGSKARARESNETVYNIDYQN